MFWSKKHPKEFANYYCKEPRIPLNREEINAQSLAIIGARNCGKTTTLAKSLTQKSDKESALVLCTFPTERDLWAKVINKFKITKTVVHTPDSLARYLLSAWAKKEGKKLEWLLDKEIPKFILKGNQKPWHDEKGYAIWLLKNQKITAGIAHWLLQNEIENFVENKMLPNLDSLYIDGPEEWEPEAESWLKHIPRNRLTMATRSPSHIWLKPERLKQLEGTYDSHRQLTNLRYLDLISSIPTTQKGEKVSCLVTQNPTQKLKMFCKEHKLSIRLAEQLKGYKYKKLYIDDLPTNQESRKGWGNKKKCYQLLDLIASRGSTSGISKSEDQHSLLPTKEANQRFLIWSINSNATIIN